MVTKKDLDTPQNFDLFSLDLIKDSNFIKESSFSINNHHNLVL